jgi:hypothetical protein
MDKIEDKFTKLIVDNLPEEKLTEFKIMIEVDNKEKTQDFIRSILPDIEKILDKNLKDFM